MLEREPQRPDSKGLPCAKDCVLYVSSHWVIRFIGFFSFFLSLAHVGLLALKWPIEMIWPRDSHKVSTPL